ncbi:MAG: PKD domain-containing protein, partial [Flavobacteriales bacterium]
MQGGNVVVSDGNTITDDAGGGPYTDTDYTWTLCPDTPGDVVQLTFSAFALQTSPNPNNSDYLSVFDGNSTAAPSLGDYTGNSIQGLQITGTVNNTSGCLTLVFSANGLANAASPGFEAQVQCTTPCANPTSASEIVSPSPIDPAIQTVNVCLGDPVTFGDNGSSAAAGFALARYIWNFDDGTIVTNTTASNVSHAFTEPGEYIVTLTVEDNNLGDDATGCTSLNLIPLQVLVSTYPTFSGMENFETCLGETIIGPVEVANGSEIPGNAQFGGGASGTTWTALPPQVVAGETYLADGAGFSYTTCLTFDFFDPGATLTDCSDLLNVFVNMEHSYMGDLGLFITCPNGTTVDLVTWGTNGGGGTYLGEAIDNESTDPGVGYDYYWEPDATNGTWGENATGVTS